MCKKSLTILIDCDGDTIIYKVKQKGFACHTNKISCFFRNVLEVEEKENLLATSTDVYDDFSHP